jgi:hypothetical protein
MNRLDEIDDLLQNSNIDPDQFKMWSENVVTQRFMLEIERDLLATRQDYALGDTVEGVAFKAIRNGEHCETLEAVLEWKPQELEVD